jgi:hypothetical protein
MLAASAAVAVAGFLFASGARAEELKHYDSNNKQFWTHPPDDWFMGDETQELKGTNYLKTLPPATGFTKEEIEAKLKNIKLPAGFKIELYASGVTDARQMAWGDKGTLFVGSLFGGSGTVHAVVDEGGKKTVKDAIKGLRMPSGIAFHDGALYVADIDKIYKYDNAEASIGNTPAPTIVYDDMPPYVPHGWKYLSFDKNGWLYVAFGPPCNICLPPTSTAQVRHINPADGTAEIVALGVRNSVGGDVDPRTGDYWFSENARDWLGEDTPGDKLNHIAQHRRAFRLSVLSPGGHSGSEIRHGPQVLGIFSAGGQPRRAHGAARHEVLHRGSIPGRLQEQHHRRRARLLESAQIPGRQADAHHGRCGRQERQAGGVRLRLDRRRWQVSRPAQRCDRGEGRLAVGCRRLQRRHLPDQLQ